MVWYSILVVSEAAEAYLAKGKSWGAAGPRLVVKSILDDLDKDSVIQNAKSEIKRLLKSSNNPETNDAYRNRSRRHQNGRHRDGL